MNDAGMNHDAPTLPKQVLPVNWEARHAFSRPTGHGSRRRALLGRFHVAETPQEQEVIDDLQTPGHEE